MKDENNVELLGQTVDDAIGEAFDKTAKLTVYHIQELRLKKIDGDENRFILQKTIS